MLGINILPPGVTSLGDLITGKANLECDVQQKLFSVLKIMRAPAFLVEFGSALINGDLNLDFGNAACFLRKFDNWDGSDFADFVSANLDEPVAVLVAEAMAFKETIFENFVTECCDVILNGNYYHERVTASYTAALIEAAKKSLVGLVGVRAFSPDLRIDIDAKGFDLRIS